MSAGTSALLVIGGEAPPFSAVSARLGEFSFVCAADSGLDVLRAWGVSADLVVGDMDSIADPAVLSGYPEVLRFPRDKDDLDTEIGLRELRSRGYGRVVMAGGGGGRLDHVLALRALLERPEGPDEWLCSAERIIKICAPTRLAVAVGTTVSVFPLSGGASGMHSTGLKWPLDGLSWNAGQFGVSNVAVLPEILVDPGASPVFVVMPY